MGDQLKDLTGMRFGMLAVIERAPDQKRQTMWLCQCDCGTLRVANASALRNDGAWSCGCVKRNKIHGHTKHGGPPSPTYTSWVGMIRRCTKSNAHNYERYGGRGITVCDRWLSFENFLADMGERPLGTTIDRRDNDRGYEPGNCKWSDTREQSRNKRSTILSLDDVQEILGRYEHGEGAASIGIRFGIKTNYISSVIKGKVWPEVERPYLAKAA